MSSPCPPWSMWWTSCITGSQSLAILCWQTNFLSQGENFACLPILMMKVKYEIKQICSILCLYVLGFVEIFHLFISSKTITPNVSKTIWNKAKYFIFYGLQKLFLTCDHRKMLTLNFDSHFPQSITLSNFHPRLKVGIVLKSELSWLSEIVQNFNPRCLRSWEIANC